MSAPPPSLGSSLPLSSTLPPVSSAPLSSSCSPFVFSATSSSSSLDYAAYKAYVLGLSDEYLSLACWYVGVGGSDFLSLLSSHCPHLSADASRDFSSGSSVLLSTLRSMPSAHSRVSSPSVSLPRAPTPASFLLCIFLRFILSPLGFLF